MKHRIWGAIFIALGILITLQLVFEYPLGLTFWPVVLVLLGFLIIWKSIRYGLISWFLLALGLWVGSIGLFDILSAADLTTIAGSDIAQYGWPVLLIAIGLSILFGDRNKIISKVAAAFGRNSIKHISTDNIKKIGDLHHGNSPWLLEEDLTFEHGAGDVSIDFTTAEIKPGSHKVMVKVGMGDVKIRIPEGINVDVNAKVGVGELDVFGDKRSGISGLVFNRSIKAENSDVTLQIVAKLGVGDMEISCLPSVTWSAQ